MTSKALKNQKPDRRAQERYELGLDDKFLDNPEKDAAEDRALTLADPATRKAIGLPPIITPERIEAAWVNPILALEDLIAAFVHHYPAGKDLVCVERAKAAVAAHRGGK
jgi:hypothetical protein